MSTKINTKIEPDQITDRDRARQQCFFHIKPRLSSSHDFLPQQYADILPNDFDTKTNPLDNQSLHNMFAKSKFN
jgi:hypothetical protein